MAPKGKKGVSGKVKKHSKKQLEKILRKQEKEAASRKRDMSPEEQAQEASLQGWNQFMEACSFLECSGKGFCLWVFEIGLWRLSC